MSQSVLELRQGGAVMASSILIPAKWEDWQRLGSLHLWRMKKEYCYYCEEWKYPLRHTNCPEGEAKSTMWVNIDTCQSYCDACGRLTSLEGWYLHCTICGNDQHAVYTDSSVVLNVGDTVFATDGDLVYIMRRSGSIVVGRRSYHNVSYIS
jgi:hypothetical protein